MTSCPLKNCLLEVRMTDVALQTRGHSYTGSLESRDCSQPVSEMAAVRVDSSTTACKPTYLICVLRTANRWIQIDVRSFRCPLTERPQPGESSPPTTTAGQRTSGSTDCTAVIRRYRPRYQGITNLHCCPQSGVKQTRRRDRAYRRIPTVRGSVRHQFHGGVGQVCGDAR